MARTPYIARCPTRKPARKVQLDLERASGCRMDSRDRRDRRNSNAVTADGADKQRTTEVLPSLRELDDLRRLGEIGHVRGIRQKLSDLASQSNDYAWLVEKLEPMSRNLDFQGYIAILSDLIERAERR